MGKQPRPEVSVDKAGNKAMRTRQRAPHGGLFSERRRSEDREDRPVPNHSEADRTPEHAGVTPPKAQHFTVYHPFFCPVSQLVCPITTKQDSSAPVETLEKEGSERK